jgi:hypothetical protein
LKPGVAVHGDELGAGLPDQATECLGGITAADQQAVAAPFQLPGELLEGREHEAEPGCARACQQHVVEYEDQSDLVGACSGRGEGGIVAQAQVGSEPVEGSHALRGWLAPGRKSNSV